MSKEKQNKKGVAIAISILVILVLGAGGFFVYNKHILPQKYITYISEGNTCLEEKRYEGAVDYFEKALKIENNSEEAMYGEAEGYIGLGNIEKAKLVLQKIISLNNNDEKTLIKVLEILNVKDLKNAESLKDVKDIDFANQIVSNYVEKVGIENISDKFRIEIIEYTDRFELNKAIEKAKEEYDKAIEGTDEGNYEVGSKKILLAEIDECEEFNKYYLVEQSDVDTKTQKINDAVDNFLSKEIIYFPSDLKSKYEDKVTKINNDLEKINKELEKVIKELDSMDIKKMLEDKTTDYEELKEVYLLIKSEYKTISSNYESILKDIYADLYKNLSTRKKSQIEEDENTYNSEKEQKESELDALDLNYEEISSYISKLQELIKAEKLYFDYLKNESKYLIDKYMN